MKKYTSIIFIITLAVLLISSTIANAVITVDKSDVLKTLGLLKGTNKGLELDKIFTRAQGTVVVLRILGKENTALTANGIFPFTDAKNHWAAKQIAYAYQSGIVHGTAVTSFTPDRPMSAKEFMALVLRGLGYKEASPDSAPALALQSGMLYKEEVDFITTQKNFLRKHMVNVVFGALNTSIKDQNKSLLQKLVDDKVVSKEAAAATGMYAEPVEQQVEPLKPVEPENQMIDPMDRIENALEDALRK